MNDDRARSVDETDTQAPAKPLGRIDTPVPTSGVVLRSEAIPPLPPPRLAPPRPRPRAPGSTPPPVPLSSSSRLARVVDAAEAGDIPEYDGPIEEQAAPEPPPAAPTDPVLPPAESDPALVPQASADRAELAADAEGPLAAPPEPLRRGAWLLAAALVVAAVASLVLYLTTQ